MNKGTPGSIRSGDVGQLWSSARRLQSTLSHFGVSETQRFLVLALVIGIFSGLLIVLFHIFIDAQLEHARRSCRALTGSRD